MKHTFQLVSAVLCSAIYLISLHAPFVYDDVDQILFNPKLHSLSSLLSVIFCDFRQIRVISNLSYALDWCLSGGKTWSFHLTNIAIHLVNAVLAWYFLDRMLSLGGVDKPKERFLIRDLTSLFFLIHPIQAEAVSYISAGRTSLLQATGFLATLLAFSAEKRRPTLIAGLITISLLLKESCVLIPFLLLSYEVTLNKKTLKMINWKEFTLYFGCTLFLVPFYFVLKDPHSMYSGTTGFSFYPSAPYLVWQFRYYLFYFWLFVNPSAQSIVHNPPDLSTSVLIGGALGAIFYFLAVFFAWRKRSEFSIASFLVILFLLPLLPTNSFVQMINPFAEYRFYLSSLSSCFLFSWILLKLGRLIRSVSLRKIFAASVAVFILISSVIQQLTWSDDRQLFLMAVENYPEYYRTHLLLGGAYEERGDLEAAKQQYAEAKGLVLANERVKTYRPWILLARIYLKQENYKECLAILDSIEIDTLQGTKPPLVYYQTYLFALSEMRDRVNFEKFQKKMIRDYPDTTLPQF